MQPVHFGVGTHVRLKASSCAVDLASDGHLKCFIVMHIHQPQKCVRCKIVFYLGKQITLPSKAIDEVCHFLFSSEGKYFMVE